MTELIAILVAGLSVGTPILYATVGETITEKCGNMNLGVEGVMLIGAVMGFITGSRTGNPWLALLAAGVAGAIGTLLFGFLTITLRCNQTVTGLTLSIFGGGFANFLGNSYMGSRLPDSVLAAFGNIKIPVLGDIPVIGRIFFQQNLLVYLSYLLVIVVTIFMSRINAGLNLRIIGENPGTADSLGINVTKYKYLSVLVSGFLCGIGGAYICLVTIPTWQNNIVGGKGWIAVTLVIFTNWSVKNDFLGAMLFGILTILGIYLQKYNLPISQYFFDMLPYLMTILIMCLGAFNKKRTVGEPESLGVAYFRESR